MVQCGVGTAQTMVNNNCRAHCQISDVKLENGQFGQQVVAKFNIQASTDYAQVGKSITEFLETDGKSVDKLYNVAEALGQITAEQRRKAIEAGKGLDIDIEKWRGEWVCVEIRMETKLIKDPKSGQNIPDPAKPGPFPRIGFRYMACTSERAADIPKVPSGMPAGWVPRPVQKTPPVFQPPPPPTPPLPPDSNLSDGLPGW